MLGQLFAGAGLGVVVGLLVGLSSSPVVAAVVGALATGLVTLLGFVRPTSESDQSSSVQGSVVRLAAFGFSCACAVLFGLFLRTHNWLSPTVADQVSEVTKAGSVPKRHEKGSRTRTSELHSPAPTPPRARRCPIKKPQRCCLPAGTKASANTSTPPGTKMPRSNCMPLLCRVEPMQNTPRSSRPWMRGIERRYSMRFTYFSVLNRLAPNLHCAVALAALFFLTPIRESSALQFDAGVYDRLKPSVIRITCPAANRAATGFVWSNPDTAVTAMHVVTDCPSIVVQYEQQRVPRRARVTRVLSHADLALLKIEDPPSADPLQIDTNPPPLSETLSTLGYPLQTENMRSTPLQLAYGGRTLRNILPETVAQQLSGGSPSLDLEIENIDGHLLPGHSGAPIFNQQRKVIAIADGGLQNGAVAISWAIPVKFLNQLLASSESLPAAGLQSRNHLLFSAEAEAKNLGEITCANQTLTKLRTVPFPIAAATADDPRGLLQLVQLFSVDPSSFVFDVYQHLPSGATFVVPAGVALSRAPNGDCVSLLASRQVELQLTLGLAGSLLEAQSVASQFEQSLSAGDQQHWMVDPQWTYLMAMPRFDGMLVRRRAYTHMRATPVPFPDGYLFETLATRKNVFIGSAAMYASPPGFLQRLNACRFSPAAPGCNDARAFAADWVLSVLSIQLTTFPIG